MSTPLADAFVRVRPDTKGFAQETEHQTSGLASSFNKLGGVIAGVFAATTIIEWGKASVAAFLDAEKSQNALQDAFNRFPALADTNIKSLEDLDAALGKKTVFDRYSIESGQAVLAQFHLTGTQLTTLTPLLLDYAAKTGKDLPAASEVLGKALLGQGRGLKDVGIAFTNTGTATGNYNELVGALRTQVGGFAADEGKSAAGQLKIMENQFKDLAVQVGSVVVPIMSELVGIVLDATGAIQGTIGWLEQNKAAVVGLAVAMGTLLIPAMASVISDALQFIATNVRDSFIAAADGVKAFATAASFADLAIAPLAIAVGAIGYLVVKSGEASKKAWTEGTKAADDYADSLIRSTVSVDTMQSSLDKLRTRLENQRAVVTAAVAAGDGLNGTLFKQIAILGELDSRYKTDSVTTAAIADNQSELAHQYGLTTAQVATFAAVNNVDLTKSLDGVRDAFKTAWQAVQATHHPMSQVAKDFRDSTDASRSLDDQIKSLDDAFNRLVGRTLDVSDAQIAFRDDIRNLSAALKDSHGDMLSQSAAADKSQRAFNDSARAIQDVIDKQKQNGVANKQTIASLDAMIATLEATGGKNKYVRDEVAALRREEAGLKGAVDATNASLRNVPSNPYSGVHIPGTSGVAGGAKYSAFGGLVTGPGTKTSDSVRMNLSAGEFVLDAETTERLGLPTLNALLSGGSLPRTEPMSMTTTAAGPATAGQAMSEGERQIVALLRQVVQATAVVGPANVAANLDGVARHGAHQARGVVPVY